MLPLGRTIGRRGRRGPGAALCAHCRALTDHAGLVEVLRPGRTKGVWWCADCAGIPAGAGTQTKETTTNNEYVDYNGGGVYHADTLIGDVFYDNSHQECS